MSRARIHMNSLHVIPKQQIYIRSLSQTIHLFAWKWMKVGGKTCQFVILKWILTEHSSLTANTKHALSYQTSGADCNSLAVTSGLEQVWSHTHTHNSELIGVEWDAITSGYHFHTCTWLLAALPVSDSRHETMLQKPVGNNLTGGWSLRSFTSQLQLFQILGVWMESTSIYLMYKACNQVSFAFKCWVPLRTNVTSLSHFFFFCSYSFAALPAGL